MPLSGPPTLDRSSTTVWVTLSLFVQVTVPPLATVICEGVNIIFIAVMLPVEGFWLDEDVLGELLFVLGWGFDLLVRATTPTTISATIARMKSISFFTR